MAAEEPLGYPRRTLVRPTSIRGLGVRSGLDVQLTIAPAESGAGIVFERIDIGRQWPADLEHALPLPACSSIGDGDARVDFVEHLMAVLWAECISDAVIRLDGPEVPLIDGSATALLAAVRDAGTVEQDGIVRVLRPREPLFHIGDDRALVVLPAASAAFSYSLVHSHRLIGHQSAEFSPARDDFGDVLAPARTFATFEEIEALMQAGMIAAGSEENCLIVHGDGYSAEPFAPNAMARHKIVDLLGDLYLLGRPLQAHVIGYRTGHADNRAIAGMVLEACAGQ